MNTTTIKCILAPIAAAIATTASIAGAGVPLPEFTLILDFNALSINRVGQAEPSLCLFPGVFAGGFTDPKHPDNLARISTLNGNHVGQSNQGSSSANFNTVDELKDSLDDPDGWTVEITDGATKTIHTYTFTLDASALVADHLRRTSIGILQPGDTISLNPTFYFITDQPEDPAIQYELGFALLYGPQSYSTPAVSVVDTQWTPDGPIQPGVYNFVVQFQANADPSTLLVPTTPQPQSFEPPLASFAHTSYYGSYCDIANLIAAPPACPGDLNGDNVVNVADLTRFLGQFGLPCSQVVPPPCADFNNDATVNVNDLTFFLGRFGNGCN